MKLNRLNWFRRPEMTNAEKLTKAAREGLWITATVRLLNTGEYRTRFGAVAHIHNELVTIYDVGKGFRSTPINLIQDVQLHGRIQ
jgi:hypothetical protein